jgi:hypothetical protein
MREHLPLVLVFLCGCAVPPDVGSDDMGSSETHTGSSESETGSSDGPDPTKVHELGMTSECVVGDDIGSTTAAAALCAEEFGPEWTWLEFHVNGGWFARGEINAGVWDTDTRVWVWIDDQDAECFSSPTRELIEGQPERFGMTWKPVQPADPEWIAASCNDATGLEGPEFDPFVSEQSDRWGDDPQLVSKCNPYAGDTPCSLCRPLLCVRTTP